MGKSGKLILLSLTIVNLLSCGFTQGLYLPQSQFPYNKRMISSDYYIFSNDTFEFRKGVEDCFTESSGKFKKKKRFIYLINKIDMNNLSFEIIEIRKNTTNDSAEFKTKYKIMILCDSVLCIEKYKFYIEYDNKDLYNIITEKEYLIPENVKTYRFKIVINSDIECINKIFYSEQYFNNKKSNEVLYSFYFDTKYLRYQSLAYDSLIYDKSGYVYRFNDSIKYYKYNWIRKIF